MTDKAPNILIVANDELVLRFTIAASVRLGYVAVGAMDAESALNVVKTTPSLRLLLSDLHLASSTGPDLIRKALRARPELKVVFMTGGLSEAAVRHTDPVLDKPFDIRTLGQAIDLAITQPLPELVPTPTERRRVS